MRDGLSALPRLRRGCRAVRAQVVRACGAGLAIVAVSTALAQEQAPVAEGAGLTRTVYVSAVTGAGAAAVDLTPSEITVREDNSVREVLATAPATDPMQIVLLVDDSGPAIQRIREGVAQFLRILQNHADFAIVSTGGRNTLLTDFTREPSALAAALGRLVTRTASGAYLLDGLHEAARTLREREAPRPVIVAIALEGSEYSNLPPARVLEALRQSGAVLHVLSIGKPTLKTMVPWGQRPTDSIHENLDENIARTNVISQGPRLSGGRLEQVVEPSGIAARLGAIAYDLRDQLAVTYARPPGAKPASKLEISVTRRGIKLRAPRTVPGA